MNRDWNQSRGKSPKLSIISKCFSVVYIAKPVAYLSFIVYKNRLPLASLKQLQSVMSYREFDTF